MIMPQIRIDTEQVASTGQQFNSKRGELESLVNQSRSLMNNLQGQFTGRRATAIFNEWQTMQPNLTNAMQTLQQASDLLRRASTEFGQVDSSM
jgi:WXG100 family type VII secretion target